MTMPSVVVMPTRRPMSFRMWPIMRTVVVLPLVPVTPMIGMRALEPGAKSRSMTGFATYCGSPSRRVGVHSEAWRRIDLDDRAALLAHGHGDVGRDEVDAGDVEADDARRRLGDLDVVRVRLVRAIDRRAAGRHVARRREHARAVPLGGTLSSSIALLAQQLLGARRDADPRQDLLVADAAPRIRVLDIDQLAHRVLAVADDARRHALGHGGELAADDQDAVVVAGDERLDDDIAVAALVVRGREGTAHVVLVAQIERHAAAVVAVERLDHARIADLRRGLDRAGLGANDARACGTGRPAELSSELVTLLSEAMSTAIALVREVIVALMRC